MTYAIDVSFSRPAPAAVKGARVDGIIRYIAPQADKCLSAEEAAGYRAVGLWIGTVFEDGTNNSIQGASQGLADVGFADPKADAIGVPRDCVMFYTSDRPVTVEQVRPYYAAIKTRSVRPVGFYGGLPVGLQLQAEGLVDAVWVTNASSFSGYGTWNELAAAARASAAVMLQHLDHPLPGIPPSAYDLNDVLRFFPAWGRPTPVPPAPIPPVTTDHPGVTMQTTRVTTMPLDSHGNGTVDVPGVPYASRIAVSVDGLHNPPAAPAGYVQIPRVGFDEITTVLRVVVEGGVPGGRYVILVAHG